jgi:hypothetical protein
VFPALRAAPRDWDNAPPTSLLNSLECSLESHAFGEMLEPADVPALTLTWERGPQSGESRVFAVRLAFRAGPWRAHRQASTAPARCSAAGGIRCVTNYPAQRNAR